MVKCESDAEEVLDDAVVLGDSKGVKTIWEIEVVDGAEAVVGVFALGTVKMFKVEVI